MAIRMPRIPGELPPRSSELEKLDRVAKDCTDVVSRCAGAISALLGALVLCVGGLALSVQILGYLELPPELSLRYAVVVLVATVYIVLWLEFDRLLYKVVKEKCGAMES